MLRWTILLLCCKLLLACGWQLRGGVPFSKDGNTSLTDIREINILSENRNNVFFRQLKDALSRRKIVISDEATLTLQLSPEELSREPLAYTRTGVPAQYKLQIDINYQVSENNTIVIQQQRITSRRNYDFDADLIIAKDREQEELLTEMRRELAQRILENIKRAIR